VAGSTNASDNEGAAPAKIKPINPLQPYNGFVISKPRFGLTIDEVRNEVNAVLDPTSPFTFDIEFLPSEEVVVKAMSRTLAATDLERALQQLRNPLATAVAGKALGSLQLCNMDSSLNIVRLESDNTGGDGWSRVAAKKAAPRVAMSSGGFGLARNAFAMLDGSGGGGSGGKVTFAKKAPVKRKEEKKVVVDDWEAAELAEEAKEGGESDGGLKVEPAELAGSGDGGDSGESDGGAKVVATSEIEGEASDRVAESSAPVLREEVPAAVIDGNTVAAPPSILTNDEAPAGLESTDTTKLDWAGEAEEAANEQS
jgi:hypothetical protein